jgi:hypothetical protein
MFACSIPDEASEFFNSLNPCSRIIALGWTKHLTELSARNLPGDKGRLVGKVENLTSISEQNI